MITITALEVCIFIGVLLLLVISLVNLITTISRSRHQDRGSSGAESFLDATSVSLDVPAEETAIATEMDMKPVPARYLVTCLFKKSNKSNVYKNFITEDFIVGDPSTEDLMRIKERVLKQDPNYVDCTILFIGKIRG